jgi:hypothetical protein
MSTTGTIDPTADTSAKIASAEGGTETVAEQTPTVADLVKGVEQEVTQAMLDAALPIMEANGFQGFKDVQLMQSQPDANGNIKQSLRVIL